MIDKVENLARDKISNFALKFLMDFFEETNFLASASLGADRPDPRGPEI